MKKLKFLIAIFIVILLSGCTVKYDINLNYDGTIDETINLNIPNSSLNFYESNSVGSYLNSYLESYDNVIKFGGYEYETSFEKDRSVIEFNRQNSNVCDIFIKNPFYKYLYEDVTCEENEYYYVLKNESVLIMNNEFEGKEFVINNFELRLTLPISAEEHNADQVDGNTYIWKYDENTTDKDIYIKINKTALEENKKDIERQNEEKERQKVIITVSIVVGVIIVLALISLILYKKYKSNKLEY